MATKFFLFLSTIWMVTTSARADGVKTEAYSAWESWPALPKMAAQQIRDKYGPPQETTASLLIWNEPGQWKRIIVYKEPTIHLFPYRHSDIVQHFINLKIPVEKYDQLGGYNGSVMIDRTRGEVSAHCESEAMNVLTLNLVYDLVTGKKTVLQARRFQSDAAMEIAMGRPVPYAMSLHFKPQKDTADPDRISSQIEQPKRRPATERN